MSSHSVTQSLRHNKAVVVIEKYVGLKKGCNWAANLWRLTLAVLSLNSKGRERTQQSVNNVVTAEQPRIPVVQITVCLYFRVRRKRKYVSRKKKPRSKTVSKHIRVRVRLKVMSASLCSNYCERGKVKPQLTATLSLAGWEDYSWSTGTNWRYICDSIKILTVTAHKPVTVIQSYGWLAGWKTLAPQWQHSD